MIQTSIEWLLEYLEPNILWTDKAKKIAEQAKEIEKTQIMNAYIAGDLNGLISMVDNNEEVLTQEEYYNKLYK